MPATSPLKRVTRARAAARKASDEARSSSKKVFVAQAAAPKRPNAVVMDPPEIDTIDATDVPTKRKAKEPSATPSATTRRRVKVTPLDTSLTRGEAESGLVIEKSVAKKPKSNAKAAKAKILEDEMEADEKNIDKHNLATQQNHRGRNATDKSDKREQLATRPRGRPRKLEVGLAEEPPRTEKPRRNGRTGAVPTTATTQASESSTTRLAAAPRKKVTFQDIPESDKENLSRISKRSTVKRQNTASVSGMRAKPIRKPSSAKSTKGSIVATNDKSAVEAPTPLSPKKITQVAKSSSPCESDEDELSGGKTPVRDLSQSPERIANLNRLGSPVKKLDFAAALVPRSTVTPSISTVMLSPARRVPPSPFKDAMKESPKRGDIVPVFHLTPSTSSRASRLTEPGVGPQRPFLQSPKRGTVDNSMFLQSATKPQKSPFKASLLQSPPKRLILPPKPISTSDTPAKVQTATELNLDTNSPDTVISSHFRSSQSPERFPRVHKLSEEELFQEAHDTVDFDKSVLDIRSPVKISKSVHIVPYPIEEETESMPVIDNEIDMSDQQSAYPLQTVDVVENDDNKEWSSDFEPMEGVLSTSEAVAMTPAINTETRPRVMSAFLFRALSSPEDEDSLEDEGSSEDEFHPENSLTREDKVRSGALQPTSAVLMEPRSSTVHSAETSKGLGFTPLAAQLSSWLASSPDKKTKRKTPERGIFSPAATQHVPGKVQVSRHSTPQHQRNEPRMLMKTPQSAMGRKSLLAQMSLASSLSGTPNKANFFADEMAIKDIEHEIESMQTESEGLVFAPENLTPCGTPQTFTAEPHDKSILTFESDFLADSNVEDVSQKDKPRQKEADTVDTDTAHMFSEYISEGHSEITIGLESQASVAKPNQMLSESLVREDGNFVSEQTFAKKDMESSGSLIVSISHPPTQLDMVSASPDLTYIPSNDIATPVSRDLSLPRFVNTVISKVPLRPENSTSPSKVPRKRSRSVSTGSSSRRAVVFTPSSIPKSNTVISLSPQRKAVTPTAETFDQHSFVVDDFGDSTLDGIEIDDDDENMPPPTPTAKIRSTIATPARSPFKAGRVGILQGAVVFVDVHTTEGADASGIFVELLSQMGAKCVKQWNWNPRASIMSAAEETVETPSNASGKIGITHVIYKDGGKRTLDKVRDARGVVRCVGVGWVLDCERENKWLDESQYLVDVSIAPRGGSRRRKSMEPKALINLNGSLSASKSRSHASGEMTAAMKTDLIATPVRSHVSIIGDEKVSPYEFQGDPEHEASSPSSSFSGPTGVQTTFSTSSIPDSDAAIGVSTPTGQVNYDPSSASPTTPYYMSQGAKLLQQTCPPKQTNQGLFEEQRTSGFPLSRFIEDQADEGIRVRLEAARRKTMNWRPRIASPLGR